MAGQEVGVKVRQECPTDFQAEFRGSVDVQIDVTLRVNDNRCFGAGVADQIRRVSQTPQIKLFEDHDSKIPRTTVRCSTKAETRGGTPSSPTAAIRIPTESAWCRALSECPAPSSNARRRRHR